MAEISNKDKAKNLLDSVKKKANDSFSNINANTIRNFTSATAKKLSEASSSTVKATQEAGAKATSLLSETGSNVSKTAIELGKTTSQKVSTLVSTAGEAAGNMKENLGQMKEQIQEGGYSEKAFEATQNVISTLSNMPVVRVNREEFLKKTFGGSPYLEQILQNGPQSVYSVESLRKKANEIIKNSTRKTAVVSFAAGLPSNPLVMAVSVPADITQFFAFALNLAQKIAYLFGEDNLFTTFDPTDDLVKNDGGVVPEDAQIRMISYLGSMLGVTGASGLIMQTSKTAGANIGKKVAAKALTKTTWYPIVKKVGSILGYKITKKTVENFISKSVPIVGGFISGGITFVTFKPLGGRLADVFVKLLNGDFDIEMELNPEFAKTTGASDEDLDGDFIEAEFEEITEPDTNSEPDDI